MIQISSAMAPKEKGKKLRKKKTISENVVTFIETLKNGFHFRCEMVTCKQYLPVIQQKLIQLYLTLVWRYLNPHQRPCQDPGDAPGLQLHGKSFSPAIPMSLPSVFLLVQRYLNQHLQPCQDQEGDAPGLQLLGKSFSPAIPMSPPSVFIYQSSDT